MQTPWHYTGRECSSQRIMRVKTTADTTPIQTRLTTTMYSAPRHSRMQHTTKVQAIKAMASPSCKWCRTGSKSAVARVFVYEANLLYRSFLFRSFLDVAQLRRHSLPCFHPRIALCIDVRFPHWQSVHPVSALHSFLSSVL